MNPPPPRPPGTIDYGLLILLGAIWGSAFILIKAAVASVPAFNMTLMRLIITVAMMIGLMQWLGDRLPPRGPIWVTVTVSAFFGNALPFLLIAWAEERIEGGVAAILMAPMPLITLLIAHTATRDEKLDRYKLAGIATGVVGVVVLIGVDKLTRLGEDTVRQLAVLGAGCCYAINVVANRGLTGGSVVGNVTAVMIVTLAMLSPIAVLAGWHFVPTASSLAAIGTLALFSTCIGTLLLVEIIKRQGASFSGQVNFLVPVFSLVWGALLLGERPTLRAMAGLALILAGVAIARRGGWSRR